MTTQLTDRLRDLADEAPGPLAAGGLWRDGRRRHRRRVATATALVGCLVLATAVLGVGGWRSAQPAPATPPGTETGPMNIPDRLFNPSPWTPATSSPGRLVAIMTSTRDHFPWGSDKNALVGVAAGSQTYRFLDLPGQSRDAGDAYLSPDGLHLAYWISGAPVGSARLGDRSLLGVAILDLRNGSVERHVVDTQHGLAAEGELTWVGDDSVALTADTFTSAEPSSYAGHTRTLLLTLGAPGSYATLPGPVRPDISVSSGDGYASVVEHRVLRIWNAGDHTDLRLSRGVRSVAYDATLGVAAVAGDPNRSGRTARRLVVGRPAHGRVELAPVPGGRAYDEVEAWVDADHVATERQTRDGLVYDVVDVRTGARRELSRKPWYGFALAGDALRHATAVPAIEPPRPWNPRLISLTGLLLVFAAGGAFVLWRRSSVRV